MMTGNELLRKLRQMVLDMDTANIVGVVQEALRAGLGPLAIINDALSDGIRVVGEQFQAGEVFLPELIAAAETMEAAVAVLQPVMLGRKEARASLGTVVIGTVEGDLHDIGKNLVATMLRVAGFQVHDLGIDVPPARFVEAVRELKPDLIGMSSLITSSVAKQKEVVEALKAANLRAGTKVMVGGAPITRELANAIGAEGYAPDAASAVKEANRLMGR